MQLVSSQLVDDIKNPQAPMSKINTILAYFQFDTPTKISLNPLTSFPNIFLYLRNQIEHKKNTYKPTQQWNVKHFIKHIQRNQNGHYILKITYSSMFSLNKKIKSTQGFKLKNAYKLDIPREQIIHVLQSKSFNNMLLQM